MTFPPVEQRTVRPGQDPTREQESMDKSAASSVPELRSLLLAVLQLGKTMQTTLAANLESSVGISLAEVDVLDLLNDAPDGRLHRGEIEERLLISNVEATQLLDSLEERGLVRRRRDPHDPHQLVEITDDGRDMAIAVIPILNYSLKEDIGRRLSADQVTAVTADLTEMLRELGVSDAAITRSWQQASSQSGYW